MPKVSFKEYVDQRFSDLERQLDRRQNSQESHSIVLDKAHTDSIQAALHAVELSNQARAENFEKRMDNTNEWAKRMEVQGRSFITRAEVYSGAILLLALLTYIALKK